ncbi:triose-phosphate isomerase [Patescibacteria group bacterium]|nr:triose-phosphate isomerase [Patescibacteria group bacterium]
MNKIIGNWKLNLGNQESIDLATDLVQCLKKNKDIDIVVCPDFVSLKEVSNILNDTNISIGAQDVFWETRGAYTGEISIETLKEIGCKYVLIGHSERREHLQESYEMIHKKVYNVVKAGGIIPVVCIGETSDDRKRGKQNFILSTQLEMALGGIKFTDFNEVIIAYEPIWAIGTGEVMDIEEVQYTFKMVKLALKEMFGAISNKKLKVLYGGSVSPDNVGQFSGQVNVDGLLVGGASFRSESFVQIINNYLS